MINSLNGVPVFSASFASSFSFFTCSSVYPAFFNSLSDKLAIASVSSSALNVVFDQLCPFLSHTLFTRPCTVAKSYPASVKAFIRFSLSLFPKSPLMTLPTTSLKYSTLSVMSSVALDASVSAPANFFIVSIIILPDNLPAANTLPIVPYLLIRSSTAIPWLLATSISLLLKSSSVTPADVIREMRLSHFEFKPLNFSNILLTSIPLTNFVNALAALVTPVVNTCANGPIFALTSLILTRNALNNSTSGPFCLINGLINSAPILERADFTFDIAPLNVSFAFFACSPNVSSIAVAKVSKSIFPFDTISRTSASVTLAPFPTFVRYSANVAAAFIPLPDN